VLNGLGVAVSAGGTVRCIGVCLTLPLGTAVRIEATEPLELFHAVLSVERGWNAVIITDIGPQHRTSSPVGTQCWPGVGMLHRSVMR